MAKEGQDSLSLRLRSSGKGDEKFGKVVVNDNNFEEMILKEGTITEFKEEPNKGEDDPPSAP